MAMQLSLGPQLNNYTKQRWCCTELIKAYGFYTSSYLSLKRKTPTEGVGVRCIAQKAAGINLWLRKHYTMLLRQLNCQETVGIRPFLILLRHCKGRSLYNFCLQLQ